MIGGNRFKTLPEDLFRGLKKLTFLDNYAQMVIESLPSKLYDDLTSLQKLYMADVKLTADFLETGFLKGPAASIQHLSLGNNPIKRLPKGVFDEMYKLTALSLAKCEISKVLIFHSVSPLTYMAGHLYPVFPAQLPRENLMAFQKLRDLSDLNLEGNPLECCDLDKCVGRWIGGKWGGRGLGKCVGRLDRS